MSFALDPSFGGDGTVIATIDGFDAQINDVALQSDGKIVVVGTAQVERDDESTDYDLLLIRFNADGTLDTTFGDGGIVHDLVSIAQNGSPWMTPHQILVQPGRIITSMLVGTGPGNLMTLHATQNDQLFADTFD